MKEIVVRLSIEDEDSDEMLEWTKRLLENQHPWLPGAYFTHVKNIQIEGSAT